MEISESFRRRMQQLSGIITENTTVHPVHPIYSSSDSTKYEEIKIPKEFVHDELNPKVWQNNELNATVRARLLKIADEFYKYLEIDAPIKDIKLVGSLANY